MCNISTHLVTFEGGVAVITNKKVAMITVHTFPLYKHVSTPLTSTYMPPTAVSD
jgi:hypothetical protein